jgi:hypothetical protein
MSFRPSFVALGLFLTAGATGGLAQTAAPLALDATVTLDGLTGKITSLTLPAGGLTSGAELEVVAGSGDNLTFELVNSNGSSSAIFASSRATETLAFTLQVTPTAGYTEQLGKVSTVTQSAVGFQAYTNCHTCSGSSATVSTTFNTAATTSPLTNSLAIQGDGMMATQQTISGTADGITTPTSSINITSTLTLTPHSETVNQLAFNALTLKLHTVPEPASASLLLVGLGCVLMTRRRRLLAWFGDRYRGYPSAL